MKNYSSNQLRNLVLVGHGGCGKTMLADAMLFTAKATDRLGKVDEGTSVLDYDPEETKRKISINTAVAPCEYNSCKINILDTPGFFDFIGEVKSGVRVADTGVIVACAVSGVEVGTEKGWRFLEENDVARAFYINKMDRENANFRKVLAALQDKFGPRVTPVYIPIGEAENFQGIVDLIRGKAYINGKEGEIPADLESEAKEYYHQLVEAAAEADDDLLGKYLEGEELTPAEVIAGFKKGVAGRQIFPVFCGSALQNKGIDRFLL
ncbi:MAG TPA: GTP-binding protein, partial [Bacillota bacterium]